MIKEKLDKALNEVNRQTYNFISSYKQKRKSRRDTLPQINASELTFREAKSR